MIFKFLQPKTEYRVVEVEKPRPLAALSDDAAGAVAALSSHPGFLYLLAKLKIQKSLLETQLKNTRHEKLRDVDFLQTGIFWCEWLENQANTQVFRSKAPRPEIPTDFEIDAFQKAQAALEVVGAQD